MGSQSPAGSCPLASATWPQAGQRQRCSKRRLIWGHRLWRARPQTALLGGWLSATHILDAFLAFIPNFTFPLTMPHGLVDFSARLKVGLDALRGFCQPERVCDWDNPSRKAEPRGDESSDEASPDNPPSLCCKLHLGSWCQLGNHSLAYLFIFLTTCSLR